MAPMLPPCTPRSARDRSPRDNDFGSSPHVPVGQIRSTRLDPITAAPISPRLDAKKPRMASDHSAVPEVWSDGTQPVKRQLSYDPDGKRSKPRPAKGGPCPGGFRGSQVPPAVLLGMSHVAGAMRELNWHRLFNALDVILRYFVPCEAFTFYLVEERGKYVRKINTYLESFPPEKRGHAVDPVSDTTLEGSACITAESCGLPSQAKFSMDWATREACTVLPLAGLPNLDDLNAGRVLRWPSEGWEDSEQGGPTVQKVHNVLAFPLRFGALRNSAEDAYLDYVSQDSNQIGADESIFGVLKLTNRLAPRPKGRRLQIERLTRQRTKGRQDADIRYMAFTESDYDFCHSLTSLLRELYFAIDPVTFGSHIERSLDFNDEPLNAPSQSMMGRSVMSGSRMLDQGMSCTQGGAKGGMFGVLGNAFAKTAAQRRRAAEIPDIVCKPRIAVTSDSTESMRSAPGWIHKEWTEDDLDSLTTEHPAGERRLGGITLLATWKLKEDAVVDPYCVICRFQLRVRRTTHVRPGQELWRVLPPFFCISPDEVTQQYCAFLTEYIAYNEEYIVCARAGSADRWSEWSIPSDPVLFLAEALKPFDKKHPVSCSMSAAFSEKEGVDPFGTKDHRIDFSWQAFTSFDARTPLPIEYRIEAWQREDKVGAAATDQIEFICSGGAALSKKRPPGSTPDWANSHQLIVTTTSSDAVEGQAVSCSVDIRRTSLIPDSYVYFSVRARYLSLPGSAEWCQEVVFTQKPVHIPAIAPDLPMPLPISANDFAAPSQGVMEDSASVTIQWPFMHPATFCPPDTSLHTGWYAGPFVANKEPEQFVLPYRVQFRTIHPGQEAEASPLWSEWHEAGHYEFVRRKVIEKHPSQLLAERSASRGEFMEQFVEEPGAVVDAEGLEHQEECLDPQRNPFGVLTEDWCIRIAGLESDDTSLGAAWPHLVQLRWISTGLEASTSAASQVLCTAVAGAASKMHVEHLILNCSAGHIQGQRVVKPELSAAATYASKAEEVVHEIKQVARLTWQMDRRASSFCFVKRFSIRYKELRPGTRANDAEWRELRSMPFSNARDVSEVNADRATFEFDIESVPLLRFHRYIFSVQLHSATHASEWSPPSEALLLSLPELVPTSPSESSAAEAREEDVVIQPPLEGTVKCEDHTDSSQWHIDLQWPAFSLSADGAVTWPALTELPVEFQVSYVVLSQRPCAADLGGGDLQEQSVLNQHMHSIEGRVCSRADSVLTQQRDSASVCCEGWIAPKEKIVVRSIMRHRLPSLRCDVRLFVACRSPAITGPAWSKSALVIDVPLPRQVPLPLPSPRQLTCMELQARGLLMDFGEPGQNSLSCEALEHGKLWAVLRIPAFPAEFVVSAGKDGISRTDLLCMENRDGLAVHQGIGVPHYALQYRCHAADVHLCGSGPCPMEEEIDWHTVEAVRRLIDDGEESTYLVSGFGDLVDKEGVLWVTFRLASFRTSHFSYASQPVCVSRLPAPSKPQMFIDWLDSPSLHGVVVRAKVCCFHLTQVYQLRYRSAGQDDWTYCEPQEMQPASLGSEGEDFWIDINYPIKELRYHGEYVFGLRTASPVRFSAWSLDSEPVRLSLEHHGMCPLTVAPGSQGDAATGQLQLRLLGREERHNYRCPAADLQWPLLTFPEGVWDASSVSPSPELTIEYRVRWRRRVVSHNDRVAMKAVMEELAVGYRTQDDLGLGTAVLEPDPDNSLQDVAKRGYGGDCTKNSDPKHEFTPWQTGAIVPAKAAGQEGVTTCCCALTFLLEATDYEVAVDWRWRRLGDAFWVKAYGPLHFSTMTSAPLPPPPKPIRILPEVWDSIPELSDFGSREFLLLHWPFTQPPSSVVSASAAGRMLPDTESLDPHVYGDYAVQCRRPMTGWMTCDVNYIRVQGKPFCVVSKLPSLGKLMLTTIDSGEPSPIETPFVDKNSSSEDALEFRIVRTGDCEVSPSLTCAIMPPLAPAAVCCELKMLPPHSSLVLSVCFQALMACGCTSLPREYQLRIAEEGGETRLLDPVRLPLERISEAFPQVRQDVSFLGEQEDPGNREELGAKVVATRSGGQPHALLEPLQFEHLLSYSELTHGRCYSISVRWLSEWRVSEWSAPANASIELDAPATDLEDQDLKVVLLEPTELPRHHACGKIGETFQPPVMAYRAELSWAPFRAALWGGGRMEYQLQRRCILADHRPRVEPDVTPWEIVGSVLTCIDDATGRGFGDPSSESQVHDPTCLSSDGSGRSPGSPGDTLAPRLSFIVEELMPAAEYQFRLFARLLFHPISGHMGEWSDCIESQQIRMPTAVDEPAAPLEAVVPDPPPLSLLEAGSVLVSFGSLPIREAERPASGPPPPAPYTLQFRGATESTDADWHAIKSSPLPGAEQDKFVVRSEKLKQHLERGVVFRLWRTRMPHEDDSHSVEDDFRVRPFSGLVSRISQPMSVMCPVFVQPVTAVIVFGPISPYLESPGGIASGHEDPLPPLLLRLQWRAKVPDCDLHPVSLHQVRYRRLCSPDPEADEQVRTCCEVAGQWNDMVPFEQVVTTEKAEVTHELPITGPRFLLGADYLVRVRMGTKLRWGDWSPEVPFSLALRAPEPPMKAAVDVQPVKLQDAAIFFRLRWPVFRPHPFCKLVEYRIRVKRVTHYKYAIRLSDEMKKRSEESLNAQQKLHVIGHVRCRLPWQEHTDSIDVNSDGQQDFVEFLYDMAADAECGYTFFVDAKHERCSEIETNGGEVWSDAIASEEVITPPLDRNWFVPSQVPLHRSLTAPDCTKAPFPLALGAKAVERFSLDDGYRPFLIVHAPWKTCPEAMKWPHRLEFTPYIPRPNPTRHPVSGDEDELKVEWHVPASVEYFQEEVRPSAESSAPVAWFAVIQGLNEELWVREQARLGAPSDLSQKLGIFARMRVVREAGPEGLQFFSSPSPPMRLRMPVIEDQPSVTVWCVDGKPHAVLWWPSSAAMAADEDKNLDMPMHMHQIRMRRPLYELDTGWSECPVTHSQVPVRLLQRDRQASLHLFDCVPILSDAVTSHEQQSSPLPTGPTGLMPEPEVMTYEFSVRVSDGYRWSDWSKPTDPCCFALQPRVEEVLVRTDHLHRLLQPQENTVAAASNIDPYLDALSSQLSYSTEGTMEPPMWVSVDRVTPSRPQADDPPWKLRTEKDTQVSQFVVKWPNLPPEVYCQPSPSQSAVTEELLSTQLIPPFMPPPVIYRVNIWLVSSAGDAAPMASPEDCLPPSSWPQFETEKATDASTSEPKAASALLYRQFEVPPASVAQPHYVEDGVLSVQGNLSWILPYLPPDRIFRCTVEAKFQTLTSVAWWTPLMCSGEFTVPRVPAPAPPQPLPICELPTPEYSKLLGRISLGSSSAVAVRWPWGIEGRALDALRSSVYSLEFCTTSDRPSLRDPTAGPQQADAESIETRPLGPWLEPKAVQLYYAHFVNGLVLHELTSAVQVEPNWVPILVASGLPDITGQPLDAGEANFIHLRWRYKACPRDLALIPTPLHFSASSGPVRTRVACPLKAPEWHFDSNKSNGINAWMRWVAWSGASHHQLSMRVLSRPRRRKMTLRKGRFRSKTAEDIDTTTDNDSVSDSSSRQFSQASRQFSKASTMTQEVDGGTTQMQPVTGWVELPPMHDSLEQIPYIGAAGVEGDITDKQLPEDQLLLEYTHRLPPREWNRLLFRYYKGGDEFYDSSRWKPVDEPDMTKGESTLSGSVSKEDTGNVRGGSQFDSRSMGFAGRYSTVSHKSRDSAHFGSRGATDEDGKSSDAGSRYPARRAKANFRMRWGMVVEWRIRICDGILWSPWSEPSPPAGLVPPIPSFTTHMRLEFSRWEPTIARLSWGIASLPEGYEHLSGTIEYVVFLESDVESARNVLQAGQGNFSPEVFRSKGLTLSDGLCGIITVEDDQDSSPPKRKRYDVNELFSDGSERRIVGKFTDADAKWINFPVEGDSKAVTGYELTVSGLRPETVHRFAVRARCITVGLDAPDWQRMKIDTIHPLRWSDPLHTAPVLTPRTPPPLLVPEPVPIPDGRFGRFLHTPCMLLKCSLFKKAHDDEFDKAHPFVVDIRAEGRADEDYRQVPLENSVYCEVEPYGPCRLLFNLPHLRAEVRTRNAVMNDISAACPAVFTVPPMALGNEGPAANLIVSDNGFLFVELTWTVRCLPNQDPIQVQLSLKRHSIDAQPLDLEAIAVTPDMILEEMPSNLVMASGEEYEKIAEDAWQQVQAVAESGTHSLQSSSDFKAKGVVSCPHICRRCSMPLDQKKPAASTISGPWAKSRLGELRKTLEDSTIPFHEVPAYRGWDDDLRQLRVAHPAEVHAAEQVSGAAKKASDRSFGASKVCQCRDYVLRKAIPVDGRKVVYGNTYRFRVRARDSLKWSFWTEFSVPVFITVPPPKPIMGKRDIQNPVPPPSVEVQLARGTGIGTDSEMALTLDVRLQLKWEPFQGQVQEVEYRVFMWTLSPEQRRRASNRRHGGTSANFETKGRCNLPPVTGIQTVVIDQDALGAVKAADADAMTSPLKSPDGTLVKPRAQAEVGGDGNTGPGVQHSNDGPQVIAHLRPYEAPPRANTTRRTPKKAAAGNAETISALNDNAAEIRAPTVEVGVAALPKGYGYIFGVEAKHSTGVCGGVGEWSAPLFSKLVEFESTPRQLTVDIDARFGALLFKANTVTAAPLVDELISIEASAVSFVDEHRDLPKIKGLMPGTDPWPLNSAAQLGKYIVKTKAKNMSLDAV